MVLEKIQDERDCDDVGIPSFYCTCYEYTDIELSKADLIEPIKKLKQLAGQIINQKQKTNYETCKTISLQDLTSAEVQILKPIDKGGNRNYRIRIMTSELATFEVYGFSAETSKIGSFLKDNESGEYPKVSYTEIFNKVDYDMTLQLQEIVRVDQSSAICSEISNIMNIDSDYCICYKLKEISVLEDR